MDRSAPLSVDTKHVYSFSWTSRCGCEIDVFAGGLVFVRKCSRCRLWAAVYDVAGPYRVIQKLSSNLYTIRLGPTHHYVMHNCWSGRAWNLLGSNQPGTDRPSYSYVGRTERDMATPYPKGWNDRESQSLAQFDSLHNSQLAKGPLSRSLDWWRVDKPYRIRLRGEEEATNTIPFRASSGRSISVGRVGLIIRPPANS